MSGKERQLLAALRAGDEVVFRELVQTHHQAMIRLARVYVRDLQTAEEVVQDAWLGALRGLQRFEGRASFKTWLYKILVNRATTRAARESRAPTGLSSGDSSEGADRTVDSRRFFESTHPTAAAHWREAPASWAQTAEQMVLSKELREAVERAISHLPEGQRAVVTLRDVHGWSSTEVCNALGISETNQRVRLHRARARVRHRIEEYLSGTGPRADSAGREE